MQADGAVGDRQPQPHAAGAVLTRLADAVERLEDVRQSPVGNAAAVVAHRDPYPRDEVLVQPAYCDLDGGAVGGVAYGVAHHVLDRAAQELAVSDHGGLGGLHDAHCAPAPA